MMLIIILKSFMYTDHFANILVSWWWYWVWTHNGTESKIVWHVKPQNNCHDWCLRDCIMLHCVLLTHEENFTTPKAWLNQLNVTYEVSQLFCSSCNPCVSSTFKLKKISRFGIFLTFQTQMLQTEIESLYNTQIVHVFQNRWKRFFFFDFINFC